MRRVCLGCVFVVVRVVLTGVGRGMYGLDVSAVVECAPHAYARELAEIDQPHQQPHSAGEQRVELRREGGGGGGGGGGGRGR